MRPRPPRAPRWPFVVALGALACQSESSPTAPPSPGSSPPASVAPSFPAPAPATTAPATEGIPETTAGRRARFESRPVVSLPPSLPAVWRKALARAGGRLTRIGHERHTTVQPGTAYDEVELDLRFFGLDAANDAAFRGLLTALALPAAATALPDDDLERGDLSWRFTRHPLIAPPGEPREIRYALRVTRAPAARPDAPPCKKIPTVAVPAETPSWLSPLLTVGSTHRLVAVRDRRGEPNGGDGLRYWMLYYNGEAADEATGLLAAAAERGGLKRIAGAESNRQRFTGPGGEGLALKPTTDDLRLGCRVWGPMTIVDWTRPAGPAPAP